MFVNGNKHVNYSFMQFLREEFLVYLEEWAKSVEGREGFTPKEKKKMQLSSETLLGIKLTGVVHVSLYIMISACIIYSHYSVIFSGTCSFSAEVTWSKFVSQWEIEPRSHREVFWVH